VAASDINYRRFFDINTLAGIRVELPEVFRKTHELIFRLVHEGRVQGLRVDHVDGLADPEGYAHALQSAVGPGFYIVVEKILEPGEPLRAWPIAGTTGYDVLNIIDGIFVDTKAGDRFDEIYRRFAGIEGRYFDQLRSAKTEILQSSFASELEVLVADLKRIADSDRRTRDYTVYAMRIVLSEIIARFPVYRSYVTDDDPSPEDIELIETTVAAAKRTSALPDRSLHDFVTAALLGRIETEGSGRPTPDHVHRFRRRFQQLTGPVMAKSLEDTLFYRYFRLLSLNEVGGDPGHFGLSVADFHATNRDRAQSWPNAMIATATHDTKRGEDARARLNAISEIPDAWEEALATWQEVASPLLTEVEGAPAPDANDQYMLLQALLGAWPLELLEGDDEAELESYRERFQAFAQKAFREAKRHTSWVNPNEGYEKAVTSLIDAVLKPGSRFLEAFRPLAARLSRAGMVNGLARTVLKLTLPGVPDTYQGTAFWDFSLVDPDNRRPVDYAARERALDDNAPLETLLEDWQDGRIKQQILVRLLADRAAHPAVYADGDYRPVEATGSRAAHVVAFGRQAHGEELVTATTRLAAGLTEADALPLGESWGDTRLPLAAGQWQNVLTGEAFDAHQSGAALRELFARLPVAVLRRTG
jgi:(1->4)-alpha-D-glucan 1-alpha-D-glucosylmutase